MENTQLENGKAEAIAQFESIKEMMQAMASAETEEDREDAEQAIQEDPLSIEIRSGWMEIGGEFEASEYRILLCTGGPAVQIVGQLDRYNEPETACLQHQDWFTPWNNLPLSRDEEALLVAFARHFYFGEA